MEPARIRERRNDPRGDAGVGEEGQSLAHIGRLNARVSKLELDAHDRAAKEPADHFGEGVAIVGVVRALDAVFKRVEAAIEKDSAADERNAKATELAAQTNAQLATDVKELRGCMSQLAAALTEHTRALDAHTAILRTPKTRTGRVMTPEGPIEMHITESREERKRH